MAYSESLAERVRQVLGKRKDVAEKKMMGGLTFMVNGKMCVGVSKNELMVRLDPEIYDKVLTKKDSRPIDFTGKPMRGFVFVGQKGTVSKKDLDYWIELALAFNKKAKSTTKKKKRADLIHSDKL